MAEVVSTGTLSEMRQHMRVTRSETGAVEDKFIYWHRNPMKVLMWNIRFGIEGCRITPEEAAKFYPQ